jgi:hypothetical protein
MARKTLRLVMSLAALAFVVASLAAGAAIAGEVQGPPGTPGVPFSGSGERTGHLHTPTRSAPTTD